MNIPTGYESYATMKPGLQRACVARALGTQDSATIDRGVAALAGRTTGAPAARGTGALSAGDAAAFGVLSTLMIGGGMALGAALTMWVINAEER